MPTTFLSLPGSAALSQFRQDKLIAALTQFGVTDIDAEYWHFASTTREVTREERLQLDALLAYGDDIEPKMEF